MNPAKLLADSRAAHYSLERQGFGGLTCKVTPDWTLTLGAPRSDPAMRDAYAILDSLRFTVRVDRQGAAVVDKVDPGAPRQGDAAEGIGQIFTGMDQTLAGFFQTWTQFVIVPPLPASDTATRVAAQPSGGWRLTYKDGEADVTTDLGRTLEVSHVLVTTASFRSTIDPRFRKEPGGLLMTNYVADFLPTSGPGKTHLDASIDYQTVSGLRVPQVLNVASTYDGQPTKIRLTFSGCRVTKS